MTVINNATTIWDCETTTGAVGNKPALDPTIFKEQLNSVDFTSTSVPFAAYTPASALNLTNVHFRAWFTAITFPNMDTKANGGCRFYMKDGTNTAYWNIAGKDTYSGGYINAVVYTGSAPDSGSVDLTNVVELGFEMSYVSTPRNAINTWIDYFRHGDGLVSYGLNFGINEIFLDDDLAGNGYGIVEWRDKPFFVSGSMEVGRTSEQTTYTDDGVQIVFSDKNVNPGLYGIKFVGDTAKTSTFSLKNSTIGTANEPFYLDMDDANIASLEFSGNTIDDASTSHFLSSIANADVSANKWNNSGSVYPQGSTFDSNKINSSEPVVVDGTGVFTNNEINLHLTTGLTCTDLAHIPTTVFTSSGTGYAAELINEITADTSMPWDGNATGYAAVNGSTGNEILKCNVAENFTLTINVAAGATEPTYHNIGLGTVVIISGQVTTTLSGHPIGATVLVYDLDSADPQNLGTELARFDNASASVQYQYSGGKSGDDVQIKAIEPGYRTLSKPYVLPATDNTFNTTMEEETN